MIQDLLDRVKTLAGEIATEIASRIEQEAEATAFVPAGGPLTLVEQDVLSALHNLGCTRPQAENAVRKAKAAGISDDFEPLFRRALEVMR